MITYEETPLGSKVFVHGKYVGNIFYAHPEGWYYKPKTSKEIGEYFPTRAAVKRSLAEE